MLHDPHIDRALTMLGRDAASPRMSADVSIACAAIVGAVTSLVMAPDLRGWLGAGLAVVMVAIAAIDARRFVIPDELNVVAFGLALVAAAAGDPDAALPAVADAIVRAGVLALLFFGVRVGYRQLRGRDGLGLGDVKLAGVAGAWLDWTAMPVAIEIAAIAALTAYLVRTHALGHSIRLTSRLPLGLFLAPAIWFGWLLETAGMFNAWTTSP